jgi:hypothetical protein
MVTDARPCRGWGPQPGGRRVGRRRHSQWVFWALVGAALVHVIEEYLGDWVISVQEYIPGVTLRQFAAVNAAFVTLCVAAASVGANCVVFALSVASLVLINAIIHIGATVVCRRYSPGVVSAVLPYIPLGLYAFYAATGSGQMSLAVGVGAMVLGVLWMAVPLGYQLVRLCASEQRR